MIIAGPLKKRLNLAVTVQSQVGHSPGWCVPGMGGQRSPLKGETAEAVR